MLRFLDLLLCFDPSSSQPMLGMLCVSRTQLPFGVMLWRPARAILRNSSWWDCDNQRNLDQHG